MSECTTHKSLMLIKAALPTPAGTRPRLLLLLLEQQPHKALLPHNTRPLLLCCCQQASPCSPVTKHHMYKLYRLQAVLPSILLDSKLLQ